MSPYNILMTTIGSDDYSAAFDRGAIDPQSKVPLPIYDHLQGMVQMFGNVIKAPQKQKMAAPEINAIWGHVFFHKVSI